MVPQNRKTGVLKNSVTRIFANRLNNLTIQLDFGVLYFEQEKVLIPALFGFNAGIRAVSFLIE
jgi:hypothetical protein